ncbi:PLP-dependent aminotransferase family protein [Streptomyces buecherae]|uniref:PLP-dependent aminotransferase family protein n=1 Tax=Streptomyces buecherae TaxID=2763006 RepID=A0A7H8N158_9ACTN|nr:PLP-dependent aminotransferase family protein [Streptomyces buecherae]QKW48217.1 PLP-dependent aminotransferase family protein [Streptomyces buecherae]QKW54113.1 PLP-dependent aminotransferase family protein [Streptomyces buecherae]
MNSHDFELALRSTLAEMSPFQYKGEASSATWSFTGGFPDVRHFPARRLAEYMNLAIEEDPGILQYGLSADESLRYGESTLREELLARYRCDLGTGADLANVMLTQGAVSAIDLIFRAVIDPGDIAIFEAPTWGVAITLARQARADVRAVPVTAEGVDIDALAALLDRLRAAGRRVKVIYTIPTFQTPTGTVLPTASRRRLAELAARHNVLLVEDGTYAALRYEGTELPSVQSFDTGGRVVRVGSFSKTIAPALRMGWVTGSRPLLAILASARSDLGVSQWTARALALFLGSGHYDEHLAQLLSAYRKKRDLLDESLTSHCADLAQWEVPAGGYFFWLRLSERVDAAKAKNLAKGRGVAARPGEQFFGTPEEGRQMLRIAFSQVPEEDIPHGIEVLGEALQSSRVKE